MIPLIPLAAVVAIVLLTGAVGAHLTQTARAARAERLRREREAQEADRAAEAAELQARDQRRRSRPFYYIAVQRARVAYEQARLNAPIAHLTATLAARKQELAVATPPAPLARQLIKCVGLIFLALAFALSAAQLIPSFRALAAAPTSIENVVLGLIVAAIEVLIALMLAHYLRPEHGWHSLSAKLAAAVALTFAILVVAAQVQWAPAHDTVPLRAQLAAAQETLAQDRQGHADQTIITTDHQQIANIRDQLARATDRDQVLAVIVTLGADISAWPAIAALGFLAVVCRHRRLRREVTTLQNELRPLQQEHALIPVRITYEVQGELERLGLNPDLVAAAPPPPPELPGSASPPPATSPPSPPRAGEPPPGPPPPHQSSPHTPPVSEPPGQPTAHPPPAGSPAGDEAVTPADLFPPSNDVGDQRRWTDPL